MIKLKDLILERPQSYKSYQTEMLKKYINPIVADVLKRQNLPVVGTVTKRHNYASDISDYYWDEDRADKPLDKKYEWAVGWNKAAGWIQLYNRDTNSETWKKYWKPKKPTRKLYFALQRIFKKNPRIELYDDSGTIKYRSVVTWEPFMKTIGYKYAFPDSK